MGVTDIQGVVLGIDANSNKIAFCCTVNNHPVVAVAHLGTPWGPKSASKAYEATDAFLGQIHKQASGGHPRRSAFLEAAVVAGVRNIQSTIKQAYVQGAIQAAITDWGYDLYLPAVSTWKKGCGAGGNASKSKVEQKIKDDWPSAHRLCGGDGDLHDACGLALYGRTLISRAARVVGQGSL